jgi:hypothetical protein
MKLLRLEALPVLVFALALSAVLPRAARAQFTYPGCDTLKASDFKIDTLVRGGSNDALTREPLKMAFDRDAQGNVDVYFVQRHGLVRRYNGATRTTTTLANLAFGTGTSLSDTNQVCMGCVSNGAQTFNSSEGLMGIALDPNFKTNGWIYLYVTVKTTWRVTRYKLNGNTLDLSSAKHIFRFTHPSFSQHMGGSLRFDPQGNLWISVSDNGSTGNTTAPYAPDLRYQAQNTDSYLGKILRIRPKPLPDGGTQPAPGPDSTYDIPAGNLFAKGTAKTLPEIYVMGTRNAYTMTLDTVRQAVAWGDVGPDNYANNSATPSQQTEEYNFTTTPGNFGWPYWAGNYKGAGDTIGGIQPPTSPLSPGSTREIPVNTRSDNTGLTNLPPARPATIAYGKACAVTGPVYYYDPNLVSDVKFPPHLHGQWLVGDFNNNWIDAVQLNAAGTQVLGRRKLFAGGSSASGVVARYPIIPASNGLLELEMGPDGALYVVNYAGYRTTTAASGLLRIEYRGTCRPTVLPVTPRVAAKPVFIELRGSRVTFSGTGAHRLELRDASGRLTWTREGSGPANYDLRGTGSGLRFLTVTGAGERLARALAL